MTDRTTIGLFFRGFVTVGVVVLALVLLIFVTGH
jgi:hypothetical protein